MKSMDWLKLHTELRTDPKLRALTGDQHRIWFNLLCLAADQPTRGVIANIPMDLLAVEVALEKIDDLIGTLTRLQSLRLISVDADGSITFCDFAERQYVKPSDTPAATAERKRRSRAAAQPPSGLTLVACETPMSRDVTPCHAPETETEKELEEELEEETETDITEWVDASVVVPDVVSSLRDCGLSDSVALHLATEFPADRIQQQVSWLQSRKPTQNSAGMLRRSIEQSWSPPCANAVPSSLQNRTPKVQKNPKWFRAEFPDVPRPKRDVCEERWFLLSPDIQATLEADARARFVKQQSALAPRLSDPNPGRGVRNLLTFYRHELMVERGFVADYA